MVAPLTVDQAKAFLRYDADDQDETLTLLLRAAQEWVERNTGHALTRREFVQGVKTFCGPLSLDWWPVAGAVSIGYLDTAGAPQTITDARLMNIMRPASIYPPASAAWPIVEHGGQNSITYTAGYETPDDIPAGLLHAMLVYAGMSDAERTGGADAAVWNTLWSLIAPYRLVQV